MLLLILVFLLTFPIPVKFNVNFNILNLSGSVNVKLIKFISIKSSVKIKNGYVYITKNNKTRREQLTTKNFNIAFIIQLFRQLYFRLILQKLYFVSNVGYYNDAMVTAVGCGAFDIVSKCIYARILHNKKSAHIFISNEAKYNQDCLNFKAEAMLNISIFDIIYSIINSLWSLRGVEYETRSEKVE